MQIRTYVFLLVSCFSSVALAQNSQNSKFAGPYAQFGVGYQTASPSFSNTSLSAAGQSLSPNISVSNASRMANEIHIDKNNMGRKLYEVEQKVYPNRFKELKKIKVKTPNGIIEKPLMARKIK